MPYSCVTFKVTGEAAMDLDGVKREAFSLFWQGTLSTMIEGCNSFVPRVGPDLEKSDYYGLGLIINHGYVLTGIFPITLNKAFMVSALLGTNVLSESELIQCFLEYVSDFDSLQLNIAFQVGSSEETFTSDTQSFLLEFLSKFQIRQLPKPSNIKSIISRIAKTELILKPGVALECVKKGLHAGLYTELWDGCQ